jgi:hypothetical protein
VRRPVCRSSPTTTEARARSFIATVVSTWQPLG